MIWDTPSLETRSPHGPPLNSLTGPQTQRPSGHLNGGVAAASGGDAARAGGEGARANATGERATVVCESVASFPFSTFFCDPGRLIFFWAQHSVFLLDVELELFQPPGTSFLGHS